MGTCVVEEHLRYVDFPMQAPIRPYDDPVNVAEECRKFAKHYFYETWHKHIFMNYASVVRDDVMLLRHDPNLNLSESDYKTKRHEKAVSEFNNLLRPKVMPMMRHFSENLQEDKTGAKLLVDVMFSYCDMQSNVLHDTYVDCYSNKTTSKWTPIDEATYPEHPSIYQVNSAIFWNRKLGFRK